jgi:hypothetical protein
MKTGRKRDHSPAAPVFRDLQGAWRSQGYGKILLIESDQYTLFEETTISCRKLYTGAIAELNHYYEDLVVSATGRAFSAHRVSGVARISFRRVKAARRVGPRPT